MYQAHIKWILGAFIWIIPMTLLAELIRCEVSMKRWIDWIQFTSEQLSFINSHHIDSHHNHMNKLYFLYLEFRFVYLRINFICKLEPWDIYFQRCQRNQQQSKSVRQNQYIILLRVSECHIVEWFSIYAKNQYWQLVSPWYLSSVFSI